METITGASNRILDVDLTTRHTTFLEVDPTDRRRYIGGKGLGLKYLYDRMPPGTDPLGPDNILAFMMGVLLGTGAPCSGRFSALTKSPLTGIFTASSCGGPFGMALKTAGFDGLLIRGKAEHPTWLRIQTDTVHFEDASDLWGKETFQAQDALGLAKHQGALVIGPAGENGVRYANILSGHRFLGRGGMGAVMGAKNLKAVVACGKSYRILPADPKRFSRVKKRTTAYINANAITSDRYRHYGTNANTLPCNDRGLLPVFNFKQGSHARAPEVSGEAMQQRHQTQYSTCKPCTILCGHKGRFEDGSLRQIPEYETVGLLGFSLGVFDSTHISDWNDICGRMGMDTISAGASLAWAMEAGEQGIFETALRLGSAEGVSEALTAIAYRRGHIGELADGTRRMAERYGGQSFAMHVKGLELAAYDPRGAWGQGLAYAVANRGGCHLSAYLIAMEAYFGLLNPQRTAAKPEWVRFFESVTCGINSLHTCQFTMYAYLLESPLTRYTPRWLLGFLMQRFPKIAIALTDFSLYPRLWSATTGIRMTSRQFFKAGDRIHVLERYMNTREGISRQHDRLPDRLQKEARADDAQGLTVPVDAMLDRYYRIRGYDKNGIPTMPTLHRLAIVEADGASKAAVSAYREIRPGSRWMKRWAVGVLLWVMGRAFQAVAAFDAAVRAEMAQLPGEFSFMLGVLPAGPHMIMAKDDKGRLRYAGCRPEGRKFHLKLLIKNMDAAFSLFTLRENTVTATVRNRLVVEGDLARACAVVRALDIVNLYLLPTFAARRAVKRIPEWGIGKLLWGRFRAYIRLIFGR